jgi:spore coat polysaccharide biosynthesis predicted glycosyltransferase SpsG
MEVRVVVGAANAAAGAIRDLASHDARCVVLENPANLADSMEWCDVALTSAGTTCMELACVGVPALVTTVAENQRVVSSELERQRLVVHLGWYEEVTPAVIAAQLDALLIDFAARRTMTRIQREHVDGKGRDRAAARLLAAVERRAQTRSAR